MNSEDLSALYEVQREIGDIFTKMKREGSEEAEVHREAGLNLEKSAQMVSQLNDFIEKYGSDTLEESDALAAAVVAEAEYINTLKGKIEEAENESNTINSAYGHMDLSAEAPDGAEGEDINAEIECKTAVMKYLLQTYPPPDFYVEDLSAEYGTYYHHVDGSVVVRWEAAFLVQGGGTSDKSSKENYLFVVDMSTARGGKDPKSLIKAVEESLNKICELMVSDAPIGTLPLITFTKRMTIMGARELGSLVAKGPSRPLNHSSGVSRDVVTVEMLRKHVKVMLVGERGDARVSQSLLKNGYFFLEKTVVKGETEDDDDDDDEGEDGAEDDVQFTVIPPASSSSLSSGDDFKPSV